MKRNVWKRIGTMVMCLLMLAMILPTMAREAEAAETSAYEAAVNAIDAKKPKTQKQVDHYDINNRSKKISGNCNVSSINTLLNRRLAYDGKSGSFAIADILNACGNKGGLTISGNKLYYPNNSCTDKWASRKYSKSGAAYQAKSESLNDVKKKVSKYTLDSFKQYVALMLHEHPEGIAARFYYQGKSGGHVIVFTKYKIMNGRIQLYVYDPVNNKLHQKFEDSYMYKNGGGSNIHNKLNFLCYLSGSRTVSPLPYTGTYLFENQSDTLSLCVPNVKATYASSNPSVCTVDSKGALKAKKTGIANITVTAFGKSYVAKVGVLGPSKLKSVRGALVKKASVSWEPNSAVSGYQLQYSQNQKFTGNTTKVVTYKSPKTASATISSLSLWKTYYFRIRSYVNYQGRTVYSPWSPAISHKVMY